MFSLLRSKGSNLVVVVASVSSFIIIISESKYDHGYGAVKHSHASSRSGVLNLNVWSAKGSVTSSADRCCACAVWAKKKCSEFVLVIKKNKKCWNVQWGPARALKASLKASLLAASIIVLGSSFHSLKGLCHGSPVHYAWVCQWLALNRYGT